MILSLYIYLIKIFVILLSFKCDFYLHIYSRLFNGLSLLRVSRNISIWNEEKIFSDVTKTNPRNSSSRTYPSKIKEDEVNVLSGDND